MPTSSRAPRATALRVLLAAGQQHLTFRTGALTTFGTAGAVSGGKVVRVTRDGPNLRLYGDLSAVLPSFTVNYASKVGPLRSGDLRIDQTGNTYRYGSITVSPDPAGGVRAVVKHLTMNQYLYGIAEVPASWHAHALRAQVVAARTFAQKRRDARAGSGLDHDLLSTVQDQVYAGSSKQDDRWVNAVITTNARFLTYKGALIDAVYSSSNGGHSETSEYVWGGRVDYLVARPDPYDAVTANPNRSWVRTYTAAQLGAWFGVGTATSVKVSGNVGTSGRVDRATVTVTGDKGRVSMTGNQFRAKVNAHNPTRATQLLSTKFVVK